MLPTKFRFIWPSGYRGEDFLDASSQVSVYLDKRFQRRFLKIGQSETRIACGDHVCKRIGTK
jgi:hypothetical protein